MKMAIPVPLKMNSGRRPKCLIRNMVRIPITRRTNPIPIVLINGFTDPPTSCQIKKHCYSRADGMSSRFSRLKLWHRACVVLIIPADYYKFHLYLLLLSAPITWYCIGLLSYPVNQFSAQAVCPRKQTGCLLFYCWFYIVIRCKLIL